jgi:integrase
MSHDTSACSRRSVAASGRPRERQRGNVTPLPSGSLRVRVYAGQDPVTEKAFYLTATVPPGPKQAQEARNQDPIPESGGRRADPRTRANVGQLIEKYFEVVDVDVQTLRGYRSKYENHIKPLLAKTPRRSYALGTGKFGPLTDTDPEELHERFRGQV